ncbi:MAG: hypothetical protein VX899_11205 [Myxococcota bacterium]|nr:hypothetical protein [Myxococcota bacterium]
MLLSLGGFSVPQLLERLPDELQQALLDGHVDNPILGKRAAVARALPVLEALESEGRVVRSQVRMKNALVDTWRLSGRAALKDLAR